MGLLYRILAELIRMVFFVVTQILVLIGNLSKYKLFNEIDIIKDFTNRVYIIIGVLMLFKLVISAVQYLVNPDSLEDKSKGLSALLQRIVISVGLLVFVPAIFQFAIKVEDIVVEQIPNIVFGNRTDVPKNSNGELDFESSADAIAYNVISGFLVPNTGVTPSTTINQSSFKILNITDILNNGCKDGPIALVSGEGCPYQMGYLALLIPIGLYLVVLFGSLAFEIGERTIKFGVIQILSPVPIVNYISDEKKLGEWSKTAIQVYTDLFIKVFVIYFVIEIIILFLNSFAANSQFQGFEAIMVKIAVIIALCLFAKKAPKFICDLLGIKGADESIGNMFKRASGMLGAASSIPGRLYAARQNEKNEIAKKYGGGKAWAKMSRDEKNTALKKAAADGYTKRKAWSRAIGSAGSGFAHGMFESVAHNKGYKETRSTARSAADRSYDLSGELQNNNVKRTDYMREVFNRRMGIKSNLDTMNSEIEASKNASDKSKAALDYVHNNISVKFGGVKFTDDMMTDTKFLEKLQVQPGQNRYNFSGGLSIDLTQMGKSGSRTIAGVLNDLTKVIENKNGAFSGEDTALASRLLDKLQGEADKYIINSTKAIESNPSMYDAVYKELGFDKETNPAFGRMIQEALEANIMHSADTIFGRDVMQVARDKGLLDGNGNVLPNKIGEWLNLNKKMGQEAQTSSIEAKGHEGAAATVKSIADKYDKKS